MNLSQHWFISVGELSGDLLATHLVRDLKNQRSQIRFSGILGPNLLAEGVEEVGSIDELNVMGLVEVLQKVAGIRKLKNRILEHIDRNHIKIAILVDCAGFHLPLAEELKLRGIKVIQLVAPKLWAWGEQRVSSLKKNIDLLLATFPFEEDFFKSRGVNCHYVGCPIVDRVEEKARKTKRELGFSEKKTLIAILPGSRKQELERLLGIMIAIGKKVQFRLSNVEFVIPIAKSLRDDASRNWISSFQSDGFHFVEEDSIDCMKASDAAIVASGTATLECALAMTPLIVLYAVNPLSYYFMKRKVRVSWISLVNILQNKLVVKEYIQNIPIDIAANELIEIINKPERRQHILNEFHKMKQDLIHKKIHPAVHYIQQFIDQVHS